MAVDEQRLIDVPYAETATRFRVPSLYVRCRGKHCDQPPVADMCRSRFNFRRRVSGHAWWAYCADHLRGYNREVRDGRVWWLGIQKAVPDVIE